MTKLFLIFLVLLPFCSFAQTATKLESIQTTDESLEPSIGEKAVQKAEAAKDFVQSTISNGGNRREASTFSIVGEYSMIDLIIPGKLGGSIGYIPDRSSSIEAEYLSASYSVPAFVEDIGSFTDKRISIVHRVYGDSNSFHFHYGLSYFDTSISVGSKYLATAAGSSAFFEMMRERSIGIIVGVGNRWTFPKGFTVGVDWISYAQPLFVVEQNSSIINRIQDQSAKDTLQKAFQASLYFPRFAFFKVGLGWSF